MLVSFCPLVDQTVLSVCITPPSKYWASGICDGDLKWRRKLPRVLVGWRDVLIEGSLCCCCCCRGAGHLHLEDTCREEHQPTAVTKLFSLLQLSHRVKKLLLVNRKE